MKKGKMNEKWKEEKCLLECLFHKRVVYTQVNWEWNIRSNTGAIRYPCLSSHISHHTYQLGQSNFQYLCHLSYNTRAIQFHPYPCYPVFVTLQRQTIFYTNFTIPLVHTNWGSLHGLSCEAYFPFRTNLSSLKCAISSSLKPT